MQRIVLHEQGLLRATSLVAVDGVAGIDDVTAAANTLLARLKDQCQFGLLPHGSLIRSD